MKKLATLLFAGIIGAGLMTTTAMADVTKGQNLVKKYLKKDCGFDGAKLAQEREQSEWEKAYKDGKLTDEIKKICPASKPLKEKYLKHIYDFLYNYAKDSGNVPSC